MRYLNVEIKARCADAGAVRHVLQRHGARFAGEDHQVDTYFHARHGRLKLREGQIERALIGYHRDDEAGPKTSEVTLEPVAPESALKVLLAEALGVLTVVDKRREIYFIDNVKFHLDRVEGLGTFVEIEAIDRDGTLGEATLRVQCAHYLSLLDLPEAALVRVSYSDLLLRQTEQRQAE